MKIYLYVKQHTITGLKYFGKTYSKNPYNYLGSGKYWKRHLNKHGKEHIITLQLFEFTNEMECTKFATDFSNKNKIVESDEWANLKNENGLDGNPIGNWKGLTYEVIYGEEKAKKMKKDRQISNSKRVITEKTIKKMKLSQKGKHVGDKNGMFEKHHTDSAKKKIGLASKGRTWSKETKEKWLQSRKNIKIKRTEKTCPHCNLTGKGPNMTRYHFDNCKVIKKDN